MSKGRMQSSGWDRIHWVTPVDEREFRGAFGVMRRKLTLEVFREWLEKGEEIESKTLDEVVSEDDKEAVVLGMLEEVYDMIHELDKKRLEHERYLRICRNADTSEVHISDVRYQLALTDRELDRVEAKLRVNMPKRPRTDGDD
jgi:hypothetical protein